MLLNEKIHLFHSLKNKSKQNTLYLDYFPLCFGKKKIVIECDPNMQIVLVPLMLHVFCPILVLLAYTDLRV